MVLHHKGGFMFKVFLGFLVMSMSINAFAEQGTTKDFISLSMKTGNVVSGALSGDDLVNIQKMTKSDDPVSIMVERTETYPNQRDSSCGRYLITYSQTGVKDTDGVIHKEPYKFGMYINLCADGLPPMLTQK
jgi:hypothetical protein